MLPCPQAKKARVDSGEKTVDVEENGDGVEKGGVVGGEGGRSKRASAKNAAGVYSYYTQYVYLQMYVTCICAHMCVCISMYASNISYLRL